MLPIRGLNVLAYGHRRLRCAFGRFGLISMKKQFGTLLVTLAMMLSVIPFALANHGNNCEHNPSHPSCQTTTTTLPTTTTTEPPTTTTTVPPTTTTTVAPGGLVIPATQPYEGGLDAGEGYRFEFSCIDVEPGNREGLPPVTCDVNAEGKRSLVDFDYFGHGMPYLYSFSEPGMHEHGWWVEGDREGYKCGYGFLYNMHPNPFGMFSEPRPEAHLIHRVSAVRPLGTGYGKVNDRYMDENMRFYDGTLTGEVGGELVSEDCQLAALEPSFDYDAYVPHGADDIRVGLFWQGEIVDIRDLTLAPWSNPGHFEFVSIDEGRVQIVMISPVTGKVSHVIYYDVLNDGQIAVEVNGVTFQDGDVPVPSP